MSKLQPALEKVVSSLQEALGSNLYSCCLYGSAVRGDAIEGLSDLNLLIVLNASSADAHRAIREAIDGNAAIQPFVLGRRGFERSVRAFAPKFLSIQRNYQVLCGADILKGLKVEPQLERFLCEQAMRNFRLRLAHAYITRGPNLPYGLFLAAAVTPFFLRLSEMARLEGRETPKEMDDRVPLLAREFGLDESLLRDLRAFKKNPKKLSEAEVTAWHARIFPAVDGTLSWMETKWPA